MATGGTLAVGRRSGPTRHLWSALTTFYTAGQLVERRCYVLSAGLVTSGVVHLGVQAIAGGPWEGPVSWRKPVTFGLAFGLTLATVTWVTAFVPMSTRIRRRLLAVFAAACTLEVAVITVQRWRGVPSHFNVSTPVNAAFAYSAAGGGAVIIASTLVFAAAAIRPAPDLPASMRLAVRAGFASFLVALAIGAVMIGIGVHATRTGSQDSAYSAASALKSGHAATMHGILLLPAVGWLGSFTTWSAATQLRIVALAGAGYLLAAGVVVLESFSGVDPLAAPVVTSVVAVTGILCLLGAVGWTLAGLWRSPGAGGLVHPRATPDWP